MILKQFVLGDLEDNNYLLIDENQAGTREAVLIDCTVASPEIDETLKEYDATLKYILLTHAHFDHVLGVNDFKLKYPECKVLLHEDDKGLMDSIKEFGSHFGLGKVEVQKVDGYLKENDIIKFGKNEIKVIHTPGHTKGGACFLVDEKLFSGDTIFYECVGRTDLPDGHFGHLKKGIQEKIFTLDDNIKIYPGHGPSTSVGHEKISNQFL